jgi:hypothetical protein
VIFFFSSHVPLCVSTVKRMGGNCVFVLLLLATITGCDNVSSSKGEEKGGNPNTLSILLRNEEGSPGFTILCPKGVTCDKNYKYRAYWYSNEQASIYMSFNPLVVNNYSLEAFRKNFDYMDIRIYFPERNSENLKFYFSHFQPIRKLGAFSQEGLRVEFSDYANNRLKGKVEGIIDRITEHISNSANPECRTGDIRGECFRHESAQIHFILEFDLAMEGKDK